MVTLSASDLRQGESPAGSKQKSAFCLLFCNAAPNAKPLTSHRGRILRHCAVKDRRTTTSPWLVVPTKLTANLRGSFVSHGIIRRCCLRMGMLLCTSVLAAASELVPATCTEAGKGNEKVFGYSLYGSSYSVWVGKIGFSDQYALDRKEAGCGDEYAMRIA